MMKANFKTVLTALAIGLFIASCGSSGNKQQSESVASVSEKSTNSKLINEWPKSIYDPYNIPPYTDGNIVCVDESPYRIPSADAVINGSTVHIAGASFSNLLIYIQALNAAGIGNAAEFARDFSFFEKKGNGSGAITFSLNDGKILQINWWGYEDQKDFYYDDASQMVEYTYNVGFFIYE